MVIPIEADATPADVGSLLGAPWQLISSTLENLTLRGVNIFTDERLGSSLLEALALASRLTQLDLGGMLSIQIRLYAGLTKAHISDGIRLISNSSAVSHRTYQH